MTKIRTTLNHLRRTPYQSAAAVAITTISFFVVSLFALIALGGRFLLSYFESRPQVTAYFLDQAVLQDAQDLESAIRSRVDIESAHYVSKDEALAYYRGQNERDPLLLEMVTADILPASLEVSAKNVADLETVAEVMGQNELVEEVAYQKDVIGILETWIRGVRSFGLVLSAILLLNSLLTIVIILGFRFTVRKSEVNTLTLLGASAWYIRAPFILEGLIYACLGAFFGWGLAYLALLYLTPNLIEFLGEIKLLPVNPWIMLIILGIQLVIGGLIGVAASLIATRRKAS